MAKGIKKLVGILFFALTLCLAPSVCFAAVDPIFDYNVFNGDPASKVINGRVYVYTTNDPISLNNVIPIVGGYSNMFDIHCYSSEDLTNWIDHGSIVGPASVTWADTYSGNKGSMWAGDAGISANGKYYAYFPVGDQIGVFVCDTPDGRYVDATGRPLINRETPGVDAYGAGTNKLVNPHFIMDNGIPYLYFGQKTTGFYLVRLNPDMISLAGPAQKITVPSDFSEDGFILKKDSKYYLMYANSYGSDSCIQWATSSNLGGPYPTAQGVLLPHLPGGATTHHSIVYKNGQYIMFYHNDVVNRHRRVMGALVNFDDQGNMITIDPATDPGIGEPVKTLTLDGWSQQREAEEYLDASAGVSLVKSPELAVDWSVVCKNGEWIKFQDVDFGSTSPGKVRAQVASGLTGLSDGKMEFMLDSTTGTKIAEITVENTGGSTNWEMKNADVAEAIGKHDLYIKFSGTGEGTLFYLNWFNFYLSPADKVIEDKEALTIGYAAGDSSSSVTRNLTLSVTGAVYGSSITWASSNAAVISNSGEVTRPSFYSGDQNVTLTASLYKDGVTDTKVFNLTVLRLANSGSSSGSSSGSVTEAPIQTPAQPSENVKLTDISGHWAAGDIKQLTAVGAIEGYPDGSFKPNNNITRAEFLKVLVRALKLEAKTGKIFNDTSNHWAKDYISTAAAYGITGGYSDKAFGPNDPITREQMVVMIVKALKLTMVDEEISFTDKSDISQWAISAINTAEKNGIIAGYQDNLFMPSANATRAEAVTVIIKAIALLK